MKSLSPNAQEFIPYNNNNNNNSNNGDLTTAPIGNNNNNNNNQNTMILLVKDPNMTGGYLQYNGMHSPIPGLAKPLTISTKHVLQQQQQQLPPPPPPQPQTMTPNNNMNQYSIYLNQTNISPNVLTTQPGPPQQPQQQPPPPGATLVFNSAHGHIIASPIAGYHSPIQPLLPPPMPQFTYNAQSINYAYATGPPPPPMNQYQHQYQINPYQQAVHTPIQSNYIDNSNDQYLYQQPHQSIITYTNSMQIQPQQHQILPKFLNKKQNNFNRNIGINNSINNNNNNNSQKLNKNNLRKNKNQYQPQQPIIDNSNEKEWPSLVSNKKNMEMNKSDDEDSDDKNQQDNLVNVVKEPYLKDENKLKMLLKNVNFIKTAVEQHYLNENNIKMPTNNRNNISFKDAILNPRSKIENKVADNTLKDNSILNKQVSSSSSQEPAKTKKTRKRSRSKKKIQNENTENPTEEPVVSNFDLNNEDFPDLSASGSSHRPNNLSENWKKVDHKSDAYSSGNKYLNKQIKNEIKIKILFFKTEQSMQM